MHESQNSTDDLALVDVLNDVFMSRVRTDAYITNTGRIDNDGHPILASRALLDREALIGHVTGTGPRVGTYLIKPGESTTQVAVLDFDSHKGETPWVDMVEIATRVADVLELLGVAVNPFVSSGGNGIHLIAIWDTPQDAYSVRQLFTDALAACGLANGAKGVSKGQVEVFPKQDQVAEGRFGNQIWLPYAKQSQPLDLELGIGIGREPVAFHVSPPVAVLERPERVVADIAVIGAEYDRLRELLSHIDPEPMDYDEWFKVGLAIHHETDGGPDGFALWVEWSSRSSRHEDDLMEYKWDSMGQGSSGQLVTGGTILKLARAAGWDDPVADDEFAQPPAPAVAEDGTVVIAEEVPRFDRWRIARGKYERRIDPELNALVQAAETPAMVGGYLAYDDFLQCPVKINGEATRMDDNQMIEMRCQLESGRFPGAHFAPISPATFKEAVCAVSMRQRVDSAAAWAESLVWDGVSRVATFYQRHLHVRPEDIESGYAQEMGIYMWTAMAGRALTPGCKADTTPIWVDHRGGIGKSTLVAALSPRDDWVTGVHLGMLHQRKDDMVRNMKGKLLGELSELRGLNTSSAEDIKAFMTASVDEVHIMYSNDTGYFKRRIFFIGTTNEVDFINHMQGDRRLGPIFVGVGGRAIDIPAIVAERDQLWAEAVALYKRHGVMWQGLTPMLASAHDDFLTTDEWYHTIAEWLNGTTDQIMDDGVVGVRGDRAWTPSQILLGALNTPVNRQDRRMTVRVNAIMKQLGYVQVMPYAKKWEKRTRVWVKDRREN